MILNGFYSLIPILIDFTNFKTEMQTCTHSVLITQIDNIDNVNSIIPTTFRQYIKIDANQKLKNSVKLHYDDSDGPPFYGHSMYTKQILSTSIFFFSNFVCYIILLIQYSDRTLRV